MVGICKLIAGLAAVIALGCPGLVQSRETLTREILVRDIVVVDTEATDPSAALLKDVALVLKDGRIKALVQDRASERRGRTVIEGRGRYAVPALLDMHVHLIDRVPNSMKLFFAHGVLFVRDMGNEMTPAEAQLLREAVRAGTIPGPDFISAGRVLEGGPSGGFSRFYLNIDPATDAGPIVTKMRADGWNFAKTYNRLTHGQYMQIAAAARASTIRFGGHLPYTVSLEEAAAAGHWTLEHARDLINRCADAPVPRPPMRHPDRKAVLDVFDPSKCEPALATMRTAGMGYVPTHVTRLLDVIADRPESLLDSRWTYVSPQLGAIWKADLLDMAARPQVERAVYPPYLDAGLQVTRLAVDAGLAVMAGSDANDSFQLPGLSLHEELALFVRAGLCPLQALQAATIVPSRFLGLDRGRLAPGMQAKILLLDANPIADIRNIGTIAMVLDGRRSWTRAELDRMMAEVRADVRKPKEQAAPVVGK